MSNPIDYAINRVMNADIDEYLLEIAFQNTNANFAGNWFNMANQTTVQQGIREQVIFRTVLPMCNVKGGKTELIDLTNAKFRSQAVGCLEVNVPDTTTGGRKIISVVEVYLGTLNSAHGSGASGDVGGCGVGVISDMMAGQMAAMASNRSMPVTYTNNHMTGNNCFVVFGIPGGGVYSMSAKVIMEYDEGMSSIHPRHYDQFAELVEWAVKAHIFRKCKRPTDEALYRSGVPLEGIKDDIAEYRDAWKEYKEYFNGTWAKCMSYSDRMLVNDTISMITMRRM